MPFCSHIALFVEMLVSHLRPPGGFFQASKRAAYSTGCDIRQGRAADRAPPGGSRTFLLPLRQLEIAAGDLSRSLNCSLPGSTTRNKLPNLRGGCSP